MRSPWAWLLHVLLGNDQPADPRWAVDPLAYRRAGDEPWDLTPASAETYRSAIPPASPRGRRRILRVLRAVTGQCPYYFAAGYIVGWVVDADAFLVASYAAVGIAAWNTWLLVCEHRRARRAAHTLATPPAPPADQGAGPEHIRAVINSITAWIRARHEHGTVTADVLVCGPLLAAALFKAVPRGPAPDRPGMPACGLTSVQIVVHDNIPGLDYHLMTVAEYHDRYLRIRGDR